MLEMALVLGMTIGLTQILKMKLNIDKLYMWLLVITICSGLNVLNAYVFGGNIIDALKDGIYNSAVASGIFSWGKNALENGIKE